MSIFNYWPEFCGALGLALGFFVLLGSPSWWKLSYATVLFLTLSIIVYGSLGRPKPIFMQFQDITGDLLASKAVEGKEIYLYIAEDNKIIPDSLRIAWDLRLWDKIEDLESMSAETHQKIRITLHHHKHGFLQNTDSLAADDEDSVEVSLKELAHEQPK